MSFSFTLCVQRVDTWPGLRGRGAYGMGRKLEAVAGKWASSETHDLLLLLLLQNSCVLVVPFPGASDVLGKNFSQSPASHPVPDPMGGGVQLGCTRNRAPRILVSTRFSSPCSVVPRKSITTSGESMEAEAGAKLSSHGSFRLESYSYQI